VPVSLEAAKAGVTTGEWGQRLRDVFGEYRAPTGVGGARVPELGARYTELRARVDDVARTLGRRPKLLIGKPGLDGHSNGAEQIALRARDAGFEVVYQGIRVTPAEIARTAADEGVHLIGLSILSGSHVELTHEVLDALKQRGLSRVPLVVGGIVPDRDRDALLAAGVAAVYTPKDYEIGRILDDLLGIVERSGT
jgi:(2R)-ethylmalonyl-CoA mutase